MPNRRVLLTIIQSMEEGSPTCPRGRSVPRTHLGTPREEGLGTRSKAYIAAKEQPSKGGATTWVECDHTNVTTRSDSRGIKKAAETKRILGIYGESAVDPGAMDRSKPPSDHQGKRSGNQRHNHDRRGGYREPIHRGVSREASGRNCSRPEDRDSHPGPQAGFDRCGHLRVGY